MYLHAKAALLMRTSEALFPTIPDHIILLWHDYKEGPGTSVGIATELRAGRSGDRIPVG